MAQVRQHQPDWRPPFCPNPNCRFHNGNTHRWRYKKRGFFTRKAPPHRIQRFTCLLCQRSFSSQTFCTTYWQKRPDLDRRIFMKTVGGMANRQIARDLKVSPSTVDRHLSRLGRHCMLFHLQQLQGTAAASVIAVDGFESFEYSQYFPMHHHLAVEVPSGFFIYFTDSELRRKGRMTAQQKSRRRQLERQLGRPDPRAVEKDMSELLTVAVAGLPEVIVRSDAHRAYPRALRQLDCAVRHEVTSSQERRDRDNPLWEINLLDLLIRHSSANHRRETLAWSKRRQGSAERLAILLVWRNYIKRRREKGDLQTAAMAKGLLAEPLTLQELLQERLFRTRLELPDRWALYYDGRVQTRALPVNRTHDLRYAY